MITHNETLQNTRSAMEMERMIARFVSSSTWVWDISWSVLSQLGKQLQNIGKQTVHVIAQIGAHRTGTNPQ